MNAKIVNRAFSRLMQATAVALAMTLPAMAIESVDGGPINVESKIDFAALNQQNFYDVIVPLAKVEGTVVFFDFSNSFEKIFRDELLPAFEKKYGVKVDYQRGEGNAAAQQLVATTKAGSASPFDVLFNASSTLGLMISEKAVANIPFNKLLPNGAAYDEQIATVTSGIVHGGLYVPFHRNQTSIAVNNAIVDQASMPTDFSSLLAWAKANPKKFAVTSPGRGGSGDGFLQSLTIALVTGDDCKATLQNYKIDAAAAKAFVASPCMEPVWNYYKELLPVAEVTNGNADTLNLIANAEASMGTAWEDMTYDFTGRGLLPRTVRPYLLKEGEVGGGDGFFMPTRPTHPAAAMLLMDFLLSKDVQLTKLRINGSRTARTDIDTSKEFDASQSSRLIPADQYPSRALQGIPRPIAQEGANYFDQNLLGK
jgi:ABC-type uncharacterized transport system YnjBCD substrate-binding protein